VINLPLSGLRLIFDPISQRLKAIEIFNMKLVRLRYAAKNSFALNFRGLTFYFHVDSKMQANFASHGLGSLHFGPGNSPVVSKMSLYCGNNVQECKPPPLPISCFNKM
jgi:hypothetical protein